MQWNEFYELWASHVDKLTERDGLNVWSHFLNSVRYDSLLEESIVEIGAAFAKAKASGKYVQTPNLSDLKSAYFRKIDKLHTAHGCSRCGGNAFVVVKQTVNGKTSLVRNPKYNGGKLPDNVGEFGVYTAPCVCQPGNNSSWEKFSYCIFGTTKHDDHGKTGWDYAKETIKRIKGGE